MSFLFFFFNDTATTDIYTYRHTLSRHDALPICPPQPPDVAGKGRPEPADDLRFQRRQQHRRDAEFGGRIAQDGFQHGLEVLRSGAADRSEEHTSELQSLMRISYAVFCLKKKNNKHTLPSKSSKLSIKATK